MPKLKLNLTKANVLPALAILLLLAVHFRAPALMHDAETFVGLGLAALLGFTPPWLVRAEQVIEAVPVQAAKKSPPPMPVLLVFVLGMGALVAGGASVTACNASADQIHQTEVDGMKVAACILGEVFGGVTDPAQIGGQCVGALPAVIVDVIDDFEAQHASDAGAPVAGAILNPQERAWLDSAKQNAVAMLARKAAK